MESQWIIVRERQAGLIAEAKAQRLARHARAGGDDGYPARIGLVADRAVLTSTALLRTARTEFGRRLIGLGTALAAEPRLASNGDCSEA